MKKFLISIAAVAVLALAPGSALASGWSGWSSEHSDNAASPTYWTSFFSNNGKGDSHYCVDPSLAPSGCAIPLPLVFTGVFTGGGQSVGCNHDDGTTTDDPCDASRPTVGAAYGGTYAPGDSASGTSVGGVFTIYTGGTGQVGIGGQI